MRGAFSNRMPSLASDDYPYNHNHEKTIHSGHFMVSCVHEDAEEQQGEENGSTSAQGVDSVTRRHSTDRSPGFQLYDGSIDGSLAGLFRQMTLAYSGKLVSPKWKNFRGIRVKLKEKIRLNNIIWREWFMQYIQRKKSVVCQFEVPSFEKTHCNPEAIVLEGKYWKRQLQCQTTEYKKWRIYHKEKIKKQHSNIPGLGEVLEEIEDCEDQAGPLNGEVNCEGQFSDPCWAFNAIPSFHDDPFFSSISHPFPFPDPREIAQEGYGRIAQPHLLQLQPKLSDQTGNENKPFQDKNSKIIKHDPLINQNQVPFDCERIAESLEINKIQRQLMEEEFEILKSSPSNSQEQLTELSEFDLNNPYANYQWPSTSCEAFDIGQQFSDSFQIDMTTSDVFDHGSVPDPMVQDENFKFNNIFNQDFQSLANCQDSPAIQNDMQNGMHSDMQSDMHSDMQSDPKTNLMFHNPLFHPVIGIQESEMQDESGNMTNEVEFNQFFENSQSIMTPSCENFAFPNQNAQVSQEESTQLIEQMLLKDHLEAARRRASTGSLATSRNRDKKHVSFAVPNQIQPMRHRHFHFVQTQGEPAMFGLVNPPKPSHPSLLEQLLIQGKNSQQIQSEATNSSFHQEVPGTRSTFKARKSKKYANNSSVVFGNSLSPSETNNQNSSSDSQQHFQCLSNQTDVTFDHQNIMHPQLTTNQQLQILLLQDSAPTQPVGIPIFNQSSDQSGMSCHDQNLNSMNVRFEMTNEVTKQTIKINTLQNFNQGISGQNQVNYHEASSHNFNDFQLFPSCVQEGSQCAPYMLDKSASTAASRSRHSSNDSSSGHGAPETFQRGRKKLYHVSAEHQRRCLIKQGFDTLNELVPELNVMGAGKINKASTLTKGAEYIRFLKHENETDKELIRMYKNEVEQLTLTISELQQRLPASGVCGPSHRSDILSAASKDYVFQRTKENWKFWIFSMILKSWMDSYNETVVTHSKEDMLRSIVMWLETKCTLPALREGVLSALPHLCKVTSILEDPSKLPQEALAAAHFARL